MNRILLAVLALLTILHPGAALADPSDVSAAARGVVRLVIIGTDGQEVYPISHGTGFAVSRNTIVTNAHVVEEAVRDNTLTIGVVPPDGTEGAYGKVIAVSRRNDLALVEIVGSNLRLPPLTISGAEDQDGAEVSAVGYPMNVDRAQGLSMSDIFDPQPPVKSRGFLSGTRPSRQFDTILHTAPIARGNSGGPLLDSCGRVLGVNSFGADSEGTDAEFYFAASTRELLPFLRANNIKGQISAAPCRSLAEIDEDERARIEAEQLVARQNLAERAETERAQRDRARLEAALAVTETRENQMAIAALLLLLAAGSAAIAYQARGVEGQERKFVITSAIAVIALIAALAAWFTRPGLEEIDRRVTGAMLVGRGDDSENNQDADETARSSGGEGALVCVLQQGRSRITGAPNQELELNWKDDGCVNGRTQYGLANGSWTRIFVPNDEAAVSVNRYDPANKMFRIDRYLLDRSAMDKAREARAAYTAPRCGADNAAAKLGDLQTAVAATLPPRPNERLVYSCAE